MSESPRLEKGTYRHNKTGKLYEVLGIALDTETNEQKVVYRPLYEVEHELFVRAYEMFIETVELGGKSLPRFEKVAEEGVE